MDLTVSSDLSGSSFLSFNLPYIIGQIHCKSIQSMINFDCNTFSLLSEEVSQAMQDATKKSAQHRIPSFGADQFIKSEIEKARYQIAGILNANAGMLFFDTSNQSSDLNLITSLIKFLDIDLVITSKSEDKDKIDFLNQLGRTGKIELKFINTNILDRFDTKNLAEIVNSDNKRKLVSLSHANRISGELLPVKEIVSICNRENAFFHLSCNLTVGKYQIDFETLSPDFMSFSSHLMHGPLGVGGIILNPSLKLKRDNFNLIYRYLQINEAKNLSLIAGLEKALCLAYSNLAFYQKKVADLKDYFFNKMLSIQKIKVLGLEKGKKGLINSIAIILSASDFGKYVKEKLELKGIAVDCIEIEQNNGEIINMKILPLGLNEGINYFDIDYFFDRLCHMHK